MRKIKIPILAMTGKMDVDFYIALVEDYRQAVMERDRLKACKVDPSVLARAEKHLDRLWEAIMGFPVVY